MSGPDDKFEAIFKRGVTIDQIKELLAEGANVNLVFEGARETALVYVARMGRNDKKEIMEALLAGGADPNIGDIEGVTALHIIAFRGWDIDIAGLLLEYKADINAQSKKGMTPLHNAVNGYPISDNTEIINFLLDFGADTSIKNGADQTPLEMARARLLNGQDAMHDVIGVLVAHEGGKKQEMKKQKEEKNKSERDAAARNLEVLRRKKPGFHLGKT